MYNLEIINHSLKVKYLGLRIDCTFVDSGVRPLFRTLNFTQRLQNGHFNKVIYRPDRSTLDALPFGRAVSHRTVEDGGWLRLVVSAMGIAKFQNQLGRQPLEGNDHGIVFQSEVEIIWLTPADTESESEIVAMHLLRPSAVVRLDNKEFLR
jgi:hypothetical protein